MHLESASTIEAMRSQFLTDCTSARMSIVLARHLLNIYNTHLQCLDNLLQLLLDTNLQNIDWWDRVEQYLVQLSAHCAHCGGAGSELYPSPISIFARPQNDAIHDGVSFPNAIEFGSPPVALECYNRSVHNEKWTITNFDNAPCAECADTEHSRLLDPDHFVALRRDLLANTALDNMLDNMLYTTLDNMLGFVATYAQRVRDNSAQVYRELVYCESVASRAARSADAFLLTAGHGESPRAASSDAFWWRCKRSPTNA